MQARLRYQGRRIRRIWRGSGITPNPNFGAGIHAESANGYGVYGSSDTHEGIRGESNKNDGVHGISHDGKHSGVAGINDAGGFGVFGSGQTGVNGHASNTSGTGVLGSGGAFGVRGETTGGIAVQGQDFGNGLAGKFVGNVDVSNQLLVGGHFEADSIFTPKLTASTKNFLIDHPVDPANQYLAHASVESSEMKTIYDGTVELDGRGEAVIHFPAWFGALNEGFRYQLTPIGAAAPNLYVGEEISDSRFKIAGGKSGMRVCWQVTGIRHDPYAQAHPLQVEKGKPVGERGHYLAPELYSHSKEQMIDCTRHPNPLHEVR
jgi:hypothetical protein